MSGRIARTTSSPRPIRSIAPGRKFWTKTSAVATSFLRTAIPSGVLMSRANPRLFRLHDRNEADIPLLMLPKFRMRSPRGDSILMTSAPWSASSMVATGPATMVVRSRTRTSWRGPAIFLAILSDSALTPHSALEGGRRSLPFAAEPNAWPKCPARAGSRRRLGTIAAKSAVPGPGGRGRRTAAATQPGPYCIVTWRAVSSGLARVPGCAWRCLSRQRLWPWSAIFRGLRP